MERFLGPNSIGSRKSSQKTVEKLTKGNCKFLKGFREDFHEDFREPIELGPWLVVSRRRN